MAYERREVARYLKELRRTIAQWRQAEREAETPVRRAHYRRCIETYQERIAGALEMARRLLD
jgi:hypothetical protein